MIFDYENGWKPLLIFAVFTYIVRTFGGFWDQALKRRNEIYGTENTYRDPIFFPVPASTDKTDPRYLEYHRYFYPRVWWMFAKVALGWLLIVGISFT